MWNYNHGESMGAAPVPDDKGIGCMVTDVTVHNWRKKSDVTT